MEWFGVHGHVFFLLVFLGVPDFVVGVVPVELLVEGLESDGFLGAPACNARERPRAIFSIST
jgi:hypothetical protein